MTTHHRPGRLALVGGLTLALGLTGLAIAWTDGPGLEPGRGPITVEIPIRYSRFERAEVTVPAGVAVTVVLRNDDPIDHEWILGDAAVHERHRSGTEPVHASRPTELTVGAGSTVATTITFTRPGTYQFICHLPAHEGYGMVGTLRVTTG